MIKICEHDIDLNFIQRISKAWFPYNRNGTCGTRGSVQGRVRLRYLRLVPGTAGRVQSFLWYRRYRTVREKESRESLLKWSSS